MFYRKMRILLENISKGSTEDLLQIAKDPQADPEHLGQFMHRTKNPDLHKAVMSNPNTPKDLLFKFANLYPKEFTENPALPLHFMEEPSLLSDMPFHVAKSLLQHNAGFWAPKLVIHPSYHIKQEIADHPETTSDLLDYLSNDPSHHIKASVAKHLNTKPEVLEKMVAEPDNENNYFTKLFAASNPNMTHTRFRTSY